MSSASGRRMTGGGTSRSVKPSNASSICQKAPSSRGAAMTIVLHSGRRLIKLARKRAGITEMKSDEWGLWWRIPGTRQLLVLKAGVFWIFVSLILVVCIERLLTDSGSVCLTFSAFEFMDGFFDSGQGSSGTEPAMPWTQNTCILAARSCVYSFG